MNYRKKFFVEPGSKVRLGKIDPGYTGQHESHDTAVEETAKLVERMERLQYLLYADARQSLLIVLQGPDAAGKDGTIRHLSTGFNPQGTLVFPFKQPTKEEMSHDFLWRAHRHAPGDGEIVIFNRSHYEDVLIVRVHKLVPHAVWSKRYDMINGFERMLTQNRTRILKFFLHISPEEQLARFRQRLDDPSRRWKISDSDYTERDLWGDYIDAFEAALSRCSTKYAPWFVIPANHKWFRNLAVSQIIADTLDDLNLKLPKPTVDLNEIHRLYHKDAASQGRRQTKK